MGPSMLTLAASPKEYFSENFTSHIISWTQITVPCRHRQDFSNGSQTYTSSSPACTLTLPRLTAGGPDLSTTLAQLGTTPALAAHRRLAVRLSFVAGGWRVDSKKAPNSMTHQELDRNCRRSVWLILAAST